LRGIDRLASSDLGNGIGAVVLALAKGVHHVEDGTLVGGKNILDELVDGALATGSGRLAGVGEDVVTERASTSRSGRLARVCEDIVSNGTSTTGSRRLARISKDIVSERASTTGSGGLARISKDIVSERASTTRSGGLAGVGEDFGVIGGGKAYIVDAAAAEGGVGSGHDGGGDGAGAQGEECKDGELHGVGVMCDFRVLSLWLLLVMNCGGKSWRGESWVSISEVKLWGNMHNVEAMYVHPLSLGDTTFQRRFKSYIQVGPRPR